MTTSDKIAGPLDGGKKKPGPKPKSPETKIEDVEKNVNNMQPGDDEKKIGSSLNIPNVEESKKTLREIDWNKVQVIEDIKIILQKLNIKFDDSIIQSDEPIRRYLKD